MVVVCQPHITWDEAMVQFEQEICLPEMKPWFNLNKKYAYKKMKYSKKNVIMVKYKGG